MKNWMRESLRVQTFFKEVLSTGNLEQRGLIQPDYVDRMLREHEAKKFNHSHRLWSLLVLELWMKEYFD
jgi:asparagine synthase (glutamine-hydrolysing)